MNKYIFTISFLLVAVFTLYSCKENDSYEGLLNGEESNSSFVVSKDMAVEIANHAIESICKDKKSRAIVLNDRVVNSVEIVDLDFFSTRAIDKNSINRSLYIINYKNDKGFAVLSSDKRLRPLYAVSDTGHIHLSDTITNKNLALFFEGVSADQLRTIAMQSVTPEVSDSTVFYPQVSPLIWKIPRQWGGGSPYNKNCFTEDGEQACVGCVAVASGIIMTYYSWPTYINDVRMAWHSMKKYKINNYTPLLLELLGRDGLLNMKYGFYDSECDVNNVYRTFRKLGYYDPDLIADFSEENIIDCLERSDITTPEGDGGPVMVYGENINTHNGHVWVIDGYCKNITYKKDKNINSKTILFHCLWGWEGDNNGYFYLNNGKLGGAANLFAGGDNERIDDRYIYSNLKFIANFKRNTNKSKVVIK